MNPKIAALIALAKEKHLAKQQALASKQTAQVAPAPAASNSTPLPEKTLLATAALESLPAAPAALSWNPEQLKALELALQAKSFCLNGAAGTGKTTITQEIIQQLQQAGHVLPLEASTKHLSRGAPGIAIVGFTNKAVNNIKKKLPTHLQGHCITIHKLLEYAPVYYEIVDQETGMARTTMRFEPSYHFGCPLPHISTVILEESSMIGTDLFKQVIEALPAPGKTQFIFLGDLNQIPPVFGSSILGFKLSELPIVELIHVYRQALLSPIISLATAVRTANYAELPQLPASGGMVKLDSDGHGTVTITPWKKRVAPEHAIKALGSKIPQMITDGLYDPEADMILCPFNKAFGTIELNKIIAGHISSTNKQPVFEVIARYIKSYWAIGDKVMVDRHEAVITDIQVSPGYGGKIPRSASLTMDRWGKDVNQPELAISADEILNSMDASGGSDEERGNLASHTITVSINDTGETKKLSSAGDINTLVHGYALTVHKSQGSEWPRVHIFLHHSHSSLLSRELLYTAITRARTHLNIICEGDIAPYVNSIKRASERAVIPGTTLQEKIEYFKGKKLAMRDDA